jgi:hypothetical protein
MNNEFIINTLSTIRDSTNGQVYNILNKLIITTTLKNNNGLPISPSRVIRAINKIKTLTDTCQFGPFLPLDKLMVLIEADRNGISICCICSQLIINPTVNKCTYCHGQLCQSCIDESLNNCQNKLIDPDLANKCYSEALYYITLALNGFGLAQEAQLVAKEAQLGPINGPKVLIEYGTYLDRVQLNGYLFIIFSTFICGKCEKQICARVPLINRYAVKCRRCGGAICHICAFDYAYCTDCASPTNIKCYECNKPSDDTNACIQCTRAICGKCMVNDICDGCSMLLKCQRCLQLAQSKARCAICGANVCPNCYNNEFYSCHVCLNEANYQQIDDRVGDFTSSSTDHDVKLCHKCHSTYEAQGGLQCLECAKLFCNKCYNWANWLCIDCHQAKEPKNCQKCGSYIINEVDETYKCKCGAPICLYCSKSGHQCLKCDQAPNSQSTKPLSINVSDKEDIYSLLAALRAEIGQLKAKIDTLEAKIEAKK